MLRELTVDEVLIVAGGDGDLATSGSYGDGSFGFTGASWGGMSVAEAISIAQNSDLLALTKDQFLNACSMIKAGATTVTAVATAIAATAAAATACMVLFGDAGATAFGELSNFEGHPA